MTNDVDDCLAWVQQAELVFGSDLTSISDEDAMMEAFRKHEQIYKEMDQRKDRIEAVLKRGNSMLDTIPLDEKASFSAKLNVLFKRWSNLSDRASHKESNFDSFVSSQEDFFENLEGFVEWMGRMGLLVSEEIDENSGINEHRENLLIHQDYCNDIHHHEQMYEMLIKNGEKILEGLPSERKKSFHEQLQRLKEGWESLVDIAIDKEEDLLGLSGVVDRKSSLSRSSSRRSQPCIAKEEAEELSEALDVIEKRLKGLKKEIGMVGDRTDEKMEHHMAICMQSDAEMEKIDEIVAKVSHLPVESDERKMMNAKIENVKQEWDEIAEALHRERSDLEKEIEVEGRVDNLNKEFDEIDCSIDLCRSISVENLQSGLEKMVNFIDGNSDIQDRIMKLPEKSRAKVKLKMLSKVRGIFDRAVAKKNQIGMEIKKIKERDLLTAEIDQLTYEVAMLNQHQPVDEDENGEDALTSLSRSVKLCLDLTEKALLLKPQVTENLGERGMKAYEEKLCEIEDVLREEKKKKEKELADHKTLRELTDSLYKKMTDLKCEEKMVDIVMALSSSASIVDLDSVLQEAYRTKNELDLLKKKACEVEDCFPEQNGFGVGRLLIALSEHESLFLSSIKSIEDLRLVYEHSIGVETKLKALKSDLISSSDLDDPKEKLQIFAHLKKEIMEEIDNLQSTIQEIKISVSESTKSELDSVLQRRLGVTGETLDNMLVELNMIEVTLEQEKKYMLIGEELDKFNFDLSLSLKDSKLYLEECLAKVKKYELDLLQMENNQKEQQKELTTKVFEKCRKSKDLIQNRLTVFCDGISRKSSYYDAAKKCEELIASFDDGRIKRGIARELQLELINAKREFQNHLAIVKSEDAILYVSNLSLKDSEDMLEVQKKVVEESSRIFGKLENAERSVDCFIKTSDLIRDEFQKSNAKKLGEFSCILAAEEKLKELKLREEYVQGMIGSLRKMLPVMENLANDAEVENMSKEMGEFEEGMENLMNENACLENELMNAKEKVQEWEVLNDEIYRSLEESKQRFDVDLRSSKTLEVVSSIFDPFVRSIAAAELQLNSLSEKLHVHAQFLPSEEKEALFLKLEESKSKLSSAKAYLESWNRKLSDWNKLMSERTSAIMNVEKWMKKLDVCLDPIVTNNIEKELRDLGELEEDMERIGNEVSQICRNTVDTGRNKNKLL